MMSLNEAIELEGMLFEGLKWQERYLIHKEEVLNRQLDKLDKIDVWGY